MNLTHHTIEYFRGTVCIKPDSYSKYHYHLSQPQLYDVRANCVLLRFYCSAQCAHILIEYIHIFRRIVSIRRQLLIEEKTLLYSLKNLLIIC